MRLKLGLSEEQKAARQNGLGGSDANILMSGDADRIHALWLEKTGQAEPEDLSRVLPVQLGSHTEEFNRYWFELITGRVVTHEGESRRSQSHPFMGLTLDGLTSTEVGLPAVFEAKHVNAFSNLDDVTERYMGQLHHAMHVTGLSHAILSVLHGTQKYEFFEVECDWLYTAQLIDREAAFWRCVEKREPPGEMKAIGSGLAAGTALRTVSFEGNNHFATLAADWKKHRPASQSFDKAAKEIRKLIEPDVGVATGHGLSVSRTKDNKLLIKEIAA